jgi:hypothetical protein
MESQQAINQLQHKINAAIAAGLNAAADRALVDIEQHVAVRTGRLRDSYAVTRRATPEELKASVGSPVDYRRDQYPYQNKPRTTSPPPLLAEGQFGEVVKAEVEQAIAKQTET